MDSKFVLTRILRWCQSPPSPTFLTTVSACAQIARIDPSILKGQRFEFMRGGGRAAIEMDSGHSARESLEVREANGEASTAR